MKVVICTPTIKRPFDAYLDALKASVPALDEAGIEHQAVFEVGCPYISSARATMTKKALDANADAVMYIDHDLSWRPNDLVRILQTDDDAIAGTYRFRKDEIAYMGTFRHDEDFYPIVRGDGCVEAEWVPAGFLKITRRGIEKFGEAYPHLKYGNDEYVDLFNHGAHKGLWYGEDYAFSRNWLEAVGKLWVMPDLAITHYSKDDDGKEIPYPGNFHEFLLSQPGGSNHDGKEMDSKGDQKARSAA